MTALPIPYWVFVVKGWTKTKLAERLAQELAHVESDAIVSINYAVDFHFFAPWRRNSALVVVRSMGRKE